MFAPAYMGRKRIFQMLSLHARRFLLLAVVFTRIAAALEGGCARLFRPMDPDFLHGAPPTDACAAFIEESRMKFANARELDRKSGCTLERTWGTRPGKRASLFAQGRGCSIVHHQRSYPTSFRTQGRGIGPFNELNTRKPTHPLIWIALK